MAQNSRAPLTSIEIVRQNNHYAESFGLSLKRTIEQISTADPAIQHHHPETSVPLMNNDFTRASGERRPLALRTGRLTASKVCRSSSEAAEGRNDFERCDHVHGLSQPSSSLSPLLTLSHPRYGLPDTLVKNFASMGIQSIYPWQSSCLLGRGLLTGEKNLVYTAPTGGGKSLVADILMLKRVLGSSHAKAILILPYVALVQEKVNWLRKAIEGVQKEVHLPSQLPDLKRPHSNNTVRIVGFFGGSKTRATWADVDIAVCTFEKAYIGRIGTTEPMTLLTPSRQIC